MVSRIEALEAFLRDDAGGEKEAFDYQKFIETRNVAEPVAAKDVAIDLPELDKDIEATKQKTLQKSNAIDSESESEAEAEPETEQPTRFRGAALDSGSEQEDAPAPRRAVKTKTKSSKAPQPRIKRESRMQTEQRLARMRRQLDTTIELHVKYKPTLEEFKAKFHASELAAKAQAQEPGNEYVYLDSSDEDEPHSASTPDANRYPKPLYYTPDTKRREWLKDLNKRHERQVQQRRLENIRAFYGYKEGEEKDMDLEEKEDEAPMTTDQVESDHALDSLPRLAHPQLDLSGDESEVLEAELKVDAGDAGSADSDADHDTLNDTPLDDTQTLGDTQAAPMDSVALRELFRKQRKELDDSDSGSDSESESDSETHNVNQNIDSSQSQSQDEMLDLPPSQLEVELGRKFQQDKEDAYEFFDRQAQESDEDGGIAPTDDDDSGDEDDTGIVENLVDDAKQVVDEDELRALYQVGEQKRDEQLTTHIRRDIVGGGWKTKKLLGKTGMLSDDEDESGTSSSAHRRVKRAKLMENSVFGKLASRPKTRAFAEAMMEDMLPQDTPETPEVPCQSVRDTLKALLGEEEADITVPDSPSQEANAAAAAYEPVLPVVESLPRSSHGQRSMSSRDNRTLYKPIPSVHAAPTLSGKHTTIRRARIVEKPNKKPPVSTHQRRGLGFHSTWGR